jgi:hypothetical protein
MDVPGRSAAPMACICSRLVPAARWTVPTWNGAWCSVEQLAPRIRAGDQRGSLMTRARTARALLEGRRGRGQRLCSGSPPFLRRAATAGRCGCRAVFAPTCFSSRTAAFFARRSGLMVPRRGASMEPDAQLHRGQRPRPSSRAERHVARPDPGSAASRSMPEPSRPTGTPISVTRRFARASRSGSCPRSSAWGCRDAPRSAGRRAGPPCPRAAGRARRRAR